MRGYKTELIQEIRKRGICENNSYIFYSTRERSFLTDAIKRKRLNIIIKKVILI
jgi:hypothetical protein